MILRDLQLSNSASHVIVGFPLPYKDPLPLLSRSPQITALIGLPLFWRLPQVCSGRATCVHPEEGYFLSLPPTPVTFFCNPSYPIWMISFQNRLFLTFFFLQIRLRVIFFLLHSERCGRTFSLHPKLPSSCALSSFHPVHETLLPSPFL